jgi:hypothetical protein
MIYMCSIFGHLAADGNMSDRNLYLRRRRTEHSIMCGGRVFFLKKYQKEVGDESNSRPEKGRFLYPGDVFR